MKEVMGMNPLLVTVADPYNPTWEGEQNLKKMCTRFDCDLLVAKQSEKTAKKMTQITIEPSSASPSA